MPIASGMSWPFRVRVVVGRRSGSAPVPESLSRRGQCRLANAEGSSTEGLVAETRRVSEVPGASSPGDHFQITRRGFLIGQISGEPTRAADPARHDNLSVVFGVKVGRKLPTNCHGALDPSPPARRLGSAPIRNRAQPIGMDQSGGQLQSNHSWFCWREPATAPHGRSWRGTRPRTPVPIRQFARVWSQPSEAGPGADPNASLEPSNEARAVPTLLQPPH